MLPLRLLHINRTPGMNVTSSLLEHSYFTTSYFTTRVSVLKPKHDWLNNLKILEFAAQEHPKVLFIYAAGGKFCSYV